MQQFWEHPKIAHLVFVLEMRTFTFRVEKHLIFIFTNIQCSELPFNFHRALQPLLVDQEGKEALAIGGHNPSQGTDRHDYQNTAATAEGVRLRFV